MKKICPECGAARGTFHEGGCSEGVWGHERRRLKRETKLRGRAFRTQFDMLMNLMYGIPVSWHMYGGKPYQVGAPVRQ